jgi:MFS family permease
MCVAIGLKVVQKVGRVKLLQYGGVVICCCLLVTGINFLRDKEDRNDYTILIAVVLLRGVFSFTLGPIVWLYMAEIVKPNIIPYGTIVNWFGATLVMLLFPILKEHLGGPGWIFIFNACFCLLSIIINAFTLVETKDKH